MIRHVSLQGGRRREWTRTRTDNSIAKHRRNLRLNFLFLEMWVSVRACVYGGGIGKKVNEVVG